MSRTHRSIVGATIMSHATLGTFAELLQIARPPLRSIMTCLREIILDVDPDSCEVVRLGERAATYGVGPKKMSEGYVYILPQTTWVNLGFYNGPNLPDPRRLLDGTGAKMRHVKIRSPDEAIGRYVRALLQAAIDERRKALGC